MGRIPPAKIKRELRQEVNFGCAVCGAPLLEYHHIVPYSEIEHHDPDHMIALCPNHHQLCDDSAISRSELYEYKRDPELNDVVDYDFYFDPHSPVIPLGSSFVEVASFGRYVVLQVSNEPIISINYIDGRMEFDINFYNDQDDLIAVVTDNEWWANTDEFWDIRYQSNRLKLWNEKYKVGLKVEYNPENSTVSMKGRFLYDGNEFLVHPSSIKFSNANNTIQGFVFVVGGDEDYKPRMTGTNYTILTADSSMNGVFIVNGKSDDFVMALGAGE
jgi:hypothetical protein